MNIENTFRAAVLALPLALSGCNDNNKGDVEKVVPTYTDTVAALIQEGGIPAPVMSTRDITFPTSCQVKVDTVDGVNNIILTCPSGQENVLKTDEKSLEVIYVEHRDILLGKINTLSKKQQKIAHNLDGVKSFLGIKIEDVKNNTSCYSESGFYDEALESVEGLNKLFAEIGSLSTKQQKAAYNLFEVRMVIEDGESYRIDEALKSIEELNKLFSEIGSLSTEQQKAAYNLFEVRMVIEDGKGYKIDEALKSIEELKKLFAKIGSLPTEQQKAAYNLYEVRIVIKDGKGYKIDEALKSVELLEEIFNILSGEPALEHTILGSLRDITEKERCIQNMSMSYSNLIGKDGVTRKYIPSLSEIKDGHISNTLGDCDETYTSLNYVSSIGLERIIAELKNQK